MHGINITRDNNNGKIKFKNYADNFQGVEMLKMTVKFKFEYF
jgi:hypothetical protein